MQLTLSSRLWIQIDEHTTCHSPKNKHNLQKQDEQRRGNELLRPWILEC